MAISKTSPSEIRRFGFHYLVMVSEVVTAIVAHGNADALAVYIYLLNQPQNWKARRADVMAKLGISKQRYANAIKILELVGVVRRVVLTVAGRFAGSEMLVSDTYITDAELQANGMTSVQFSGRSKNMGAPDSGALDTTTVREDGHITNAGDLTRAGCDNQLSKGSSSSKKVPTEFEPPDWWPPEKWRAYVQARRQKGHPRTDASFQLCVDAVWKTHLTGIDLNLIIDEMVATGWRTAKPKYFQDKENAKSSDTCQARQSVVDRVAAATGLNPHDPNSFDFEQFGDERDRRNSATDGGQVVAVDGEALRVQVD